MAERTVFLVNPASDNGATGRRWPELAHRAATAGLHGDVLFSEEPGHLTRLAREVAADGAALVVAVGGDGTVNEVVNGLAGAAGVELAVLHRGTGVDFGRTYAIPRSFDEAVTVARDGAVREIDAGRVAFRAWAGGDEVSYFANVASAGMSGAVAQRANTTSKLLGGKASYLWAIFAVFARWQNGDLRISVDGEIRGGRMQDVVIANGRFLAGGMKMCPEAEPDDGLFDVLLLGDLTKADLARNVPKVFRGTHLPHPKAELLRGASVTVDADEPLPVQLDGEQPGTTPARFEVVPRAVRLRVPR